MPDEIEELDLICWNIEEEKSDGMPKHYFEGKHQIPYKSKNIWFISDSANWKSQSVNELNKPSLIYDSKLGEGQSPNKDKTYEDDIQGDPFNDVNYREISRHSVNQFLNSGKPINKSNEATPTKK